MNFPRDRTASASFVYGGELQRPEVRENRAAAAREARERKSRLKADPTPAAIPDARFPLKFPRILGDSLFFADLRGSGRADHLVLKDRYTNFWVIDSTLQTLWHGSCTTGHYPWSMDVDHDGQQELFVGYSFYSPLTISSTLVPSVKQ